MPYSPYQFKSLEEIKTKCQEEGVELPFTDNIKLLNTPYTLSNHVLPNRIVFQPMQYQ